MWGSPYIRQYIVPQPEHVGADGFKVVVAVVVVGASVVGPSGVGPPGPGGVGNDGGNQQPVTGVDGNFGGVMLQNQPEIIPG